MSFPLGFNDVSYLLAFLAIMLLVMSELIIPIYGDTGFILEKGRFRKVSFILGLIFLSIIAIRIYQIIITR